jgi:hypothetical protein
MMSMAQITESSLQDVSPKSAWQLFVILLSGKWQPGDFWNKANYRRKFLWRGLQAPLSTWQLLDMLVCLPELQRLLICQSRLPVRLQRAYLALKFTRKQSLHALLFHYQTMSARLSYEQRMDWLSPRGLRLATLEGKEGHDFYIALTSEVNLDKEGDCTMVIHDVQARVLAKITYTLCRYQGKSTLFIGGLQGASGDISHEIIQSATKACYGLFPKRIVLDAVCHFARHMRAEQILAVGNEVHIYRNARYRGQAAQMYADYDNFWQSQGGRLNNEGYYILPLHLARKELDAIPSKKRAEYRRRFALLDELAEQMRMTLS